MSKPTGINIATKFGIGEFVWFMRSNKAESAEITMIRVTAERIGGVDYSNPKPKIVYSFKGLTDQNEEELFESKEELLKSL